MQQVLKELGIDRGTAAMALIERGPRKVPLIGKVIGVGMVDEITDRTWVVIDAIDGRVHYADLGRIQWGHVDPRSRPHAAGAGVSTRIASPNQSSLAGQHASCRPVQEGSPTMNDGNPVSSPAEPRRAARNKGKLTGPKPPLRPDHVWSIRAKLQLERGIRDLALFNLAIDSNLRACDLSPRATYVCAAPRGPAMPVTQDSTRSSCCSVAADLQQHRGLRTRATKPMPHRYSPTAGLIPAVP
jgi:hypothetical protein